MQILPQVHQVAGRLVNFYLFESDGGLYLFDTGLPGDRKILQELVEGLGYSYAQLQAILITHADVDHAGNLAYLQAESNAAVYASQVEAEAIARGESSRELKLPWLMKQIARLFRKYLYFDPAQVDHRVSDGQVLPFLGGVHVVSTPGHTPDHVSYWLPGYSLLIAGDSLRSSRRGLHPSTGVNTWDEELALESVRKQAAFEPELVCVGHGPVVRGAAEILNEIG
jgi:glyoxylase-like metal-dependent hydrolase (beta-lactamase superfamily II)